MLQSQLFTRTKKEAPKDEVSKNAQLLIKAGFVHKEMAGVYSYLPLGLRVFNNILKVIREEMNKIGGQELVLTALQEKSTWEATNRWDDAVVDNWFKTKLKNDTELGLGFTHEEPLTKLMTEYVSSYRDLPFSAYQFQTKFRNETRAKSGIMRTREFVMKDLYSFSQNEAEHMDFYEKAKAAYKKIFERVGIGHLTYLTFASGGVFSPFSHEFQTLTSAGEDTIYVDKEKGIAVNKEVYTDEVLRDLGLTKENLTEERAVEVGNIFTLGTRFSDALGLKYKTEKGEEKSVFMGSYGIGPGRLMGTIVEVLADEKGLVWPANIAPFTVHLIDLSGKNEEVAAHAKEIYTMLQAHDIEVLFDNRATSAGEKFADSDLIGIPYRVVVSEKTMKDSVVELKNRQTGEVTRITPDELRDHVRKIL